MKYKTCTKSDCECSICREHKTEIYTDGWKRGREDERRKMREWIETETNIIHDAFLSYLEEA